MFDGPTLPGTPHQVETSPQASHPPDSPSTVPRSASYTQLPTDAKVDATPTRKPSLSRSFSENILANIQGNVSRQNPTRKGPVNASHSPKKSLRRLGSSKRQRDPDTPVTIAKFAIGPDLSSQDRQDETKISKDGTIQGNVRKAPSVAESISTLARKSWISQSRSPSPSPTKTRRRKETALGTDSTRHVNGSSPAVDAITSSSSPAEVKDNTPEYSSNGHAKGGIPRRNSVLARSRRPLSSFMGKASSPETPSVPPIPTSYSTDRLPLSTIQSTSSKPPAVPNSWSSERLQGLGTETPRRKDELWGAFRTIDGEYQKWVNEETRSP